MACEGYDPNEGIPEEISWLYAQPQKGFVSGDSAARTPFWTALESLAWIVSRSGEFAEHIGKIERQEFGEVHPKAALGQLLLISSTQFCSCNSQDSSNDVFQNDDGTYDYIGPETFWRDCSCLGDASRKLLALIQESKVLPIDDERKSRVAFEELVSLDSRDSCSDWLDLGMELWFVSAEILKAFPAVETINDSKVATTPTTGAEIECRKWLVTAFGADTDHKRAKSEFQADALAQFGSRLSRRGFLRAWDAVARDAGRSKPGRKS